MSALTVQQKIILHLSQFTSYQGKIVVPSAITQEGIAEAIGVQRPHISVDIKRMMKKGLVGEFKAHAGGRKKRKAYYLTYEGLKRYSSIIEHLRNRRVTLELTEFEREMRGEEAVDYLSSHMNLPYPTAVELVIQAQRITKKDVENRKHRMRRIIYSSSIPEIPELLGREEELERIDRWYRSRSVCLSVVGTAGIGKTALVAHFVSKLRSPVFWHRTEEWESLYSVLMDLADFLSKNGNMTLKSYLSNPDFDLGMMGRIFQNIEDRQIWVFDDYQKTPPTMRNLFDLLLHSLEQTPVRLIVISRSIPDFYSRRDVSIKRQVQEIFLDGLSPEAARDLLVRKGLYPKEQIFREIYEFTGGHPLTLELVAISGMRKTGARAYLSEEFYQNLRPAERRMLSQISVHRKHALPEAFVSLEKDVETLKSLIRKGIVYYDTEEKYFVHDVIKSFFRERGEQRREHMLAYRYYSSKDGIEEKIEAFYHILMAGNQEKAAELAGELVDEAIIKGKANELLSILNVKPSDLYGLLLVKGKALQATGKMKEAERIAKSLIRNAKGEEKLEAMSLLSLAYISSAKLEKAVEILEEALKMAKSPETEAGIRYNLGMVYVRRSDYSNAERELTESMKLYREIGEEVKWSRIRAQYASVLAGKGDYDSAIKILKELAEFFEERGDYRVLGSIYNNLGTYQAKAGMRIEAIESLEKAALYGDLAGHMQLIAYALMNSANNYLVLGDTSKALSMAEKARKTMDKIGDLRGMAILKTVIAEAHEVLGNDAQKYYEDAEKSLLALGLKKHLGEMYMERGDIAKSKEKKLEYYKKALNIFKEIGYEGGIRQVREKSDGNIS